jgi:5-methylcytosine-specific restriction endonuclease McrA
MVPWNKRPKHAKSCEHCGTIFMISDWQRNRKFCTKACAYDGRELRGTFAAGHPDLVPTDKRGHSKATREKIKASARAIAKIGPEHFNWRGGKRKERQEAMARYEYRDWRTAVFERDNYTCCGCGQRGKTLQADHIKPWATHPELRYEVSNGRTLCVPCHRATPTWGAGAKHG